MYKYTIKISFPLGARLNSNIDLFLYKSFLKMVKQLSCINIESRCKDCALKDNCQYNKVTGANFQNYPGIIFKQNCFSKSFYRENEEYKLDIYLIGKLDQYKAYIEIFFLEYLQHKIAGYPFQIKSMAKGYIEESILTVDQLKVNSLIESTNFIDSYNQMVHYYNQVYDTKYLMIDTDYTVSNVKNVHLQDIKFITYKLLVKGYIYQMKGELNIPKELIEIGIGKYNYIGGGNIAIEN